MLRLDILVQTGIQISKEHINNSIKRVMRQLHAINSNKVVEVELKSLHYEIWCNLVTLTEAHEICDMLIELSLCIHTDYIHVISNGNSAIHCITNGLFPLLLWTQISNTFVKVYQISPKLEQFYHKMVT